MTPSRFQVPPFLALQSQRTSGGPPSRETFLSLPSAKKPLNRLSGDQNGNAACSVPGSSLASAVSSDRTHRVNPPCEDPTKATCRPFGDTASCGAMPVPPPGRPPNLV